MDPQVMAAIFGGSPSNFIGGPGDVITTLPNAIASTSLSDASQVAAPAMPFATGFDASAAGITFAPSPLVLGGGTTIPSALNFDLPLAGLNVDQAAQAYLFTTNATQNAYGFETQAANSTLSFAGGFFSSIIDALKQIGTAEASAMNTAASKISGGCSGLLGCLFG